jgi:NDP-sugar pyrophosphorylase family protein
METRCWCGVRTDEQLNEWVGSFRELHGRCESLRQLRSRYRSQSVNRMVKDRPSILEPVHIGVRSTIQAGALVREPAVIADDVEAERSAELGDSGGGLSRGILAERCPMLNGAKVEARAAIACPLVASGYQYGAHSLPGVGPVSDYSVAAEQMTEFAVMGTKLPIGPDIIAEVEASIGECAAVDRGIVVATA